MSWVEDVKAILDDLANSTDGLGALKTLIDAIPTAAQIQTELEENGASLLDTIRDELANATDGLSALKTLLDAIPTTMRGTDGVDTATMRGTDSAATVADGWDAALATILDNFSAIRIGYLDELDFALQEAIAAIPTTMVGTDGAALATVLEDAMQKATGPAYNQDTDSQEALRELLDTMVTSIAALQTDLDNPGQYKADLTTLETRLSAARAGYLDQLDFALQEAIAAIPTTMVGTNNAALASAWTAALATALGNYTSTRAGYIDNLSGGAVTASGPTKAEMDTGHGLLATEAKQDIIDTNVDDIEALVDTAETDASYSYTNAGGEQDVYTDAVTTRRKISFSMDINAMTIGGVVKIYLKVDGTNYRVWIRKDVDSIGSTGTEDVYTIEVITNQNFKISYTEDADEGADRSIPYSVVTKVME